jgi:hypothetical protein
MKSAITSVGRLDDLCRDVESFGPGCDALGSDARARRTFARTGEILGGGDRRTMARDGVKVCTGGNEVDCWRRGMKACSDWATV